MPTSLNILVACEESGIVRRALRALGHNAISCDLKPARDGSPHHVQGDVRHLLQQQWDAMIAHPVCRRLTNAGVRWLTVPPTRLNPEHDTPEMCAWYQAQSYEVRRQYMWDELQKGADFFSDLWNAPNIPNIVIENPVMHGYAKARIRNYEEFSESHHPWHFGTDERGPDNVKKRICLWTRGPLVSKTLNRTGTLDGTTARSEVHNCPPGPRRSEIRSTFFPGIASAMALQWFGDAR